MKKISLICFSIVIMLFINYGCYSVVTIVHKGETQKLRDAGKPPCGGFGGAVVGCDMLTGYALTWDKDENWVRNWYQKAPAAFGFAVVDMLAGDIIYKLFYRDDKQPRKEESPKSHR
ncbi:MAG: hypothetical protein HZA49_08160 [Planctomycetes bacterium]|nr:hypothetical protein [Planctomycetota bacterium]